MRHPRSKLKVSFYLYFCCFWINVTQRNFENIKRKIQRIISDSCFQLKLWFNVDARAPSIPLLNFPFKYVIIKSVVGSISNNCTCQKTLLYNCECGHKLSIRLIYLVLLFIIHLIHYLPLFQTLLMEISIMSIIFVALIDMKENWRRLKDFFFMFTKIQRVNQSFWQTLIDITGKELLALPLNHLVILFLFTALLEASIEYFMAMSLLRKQT